MTAEAIARIDSVLREYAELVEDMEKVIPSHLVHKMGHALTEARALISEPPCPQDFSDDEREAHLMQDRIDFYVDHEAEPGISRNAFLRGWDAAASRNRRHVPLTDKMVRSIMGAAWGSGPVGTVSYMRAAIEAWEAKHN